MQYCRQASVRLSFRRPGTVKLVCMSCAASTSHFCLCVHCLVSVAGQVISLQLTDSIQISTELLWHMNTATVCLGHMQCQFS